MPTSERYARYRADQTTIWVSKTAADFLQKERNSAGEGASAVLDRMINEYKKMRRASGGGAAGGATKSAAKPASKTSAAKPAAKSAGAGTRGSRSAARGASKGAAKSGR